MIILLIIDAKIHRYFTKNVVLCKSKRVLFTHYVKGKIIYKSIYNWNMIRLNIICISRKYSWLEFQFMKLYQHIGRVHFKLSFSFWSMQYLYYPNV